MNHAPTSAASQATARLGGKTATAIEPLRAGRV